MEYSDKNFSVNNHTSDLIDFSDSFKGTNALPLIPCPKSLQSTIDSNPFDVVAIQAETDSNDPFETVFNAAFCTPNSKTKEVKNVNKDILNSKDKHVRNNCSDNVSYSLETSEPEASSAKSNTIVNQTIPIQIESVQSVVSRNNCEVVCSTPCKKNNDLICDCSDKISSKFYSPIENNEPIKNNNDLNIPFINSVENFSHSSLDLSNEENLRASIRKRIQRVFYNTTGENSAPLSERLSTHHNKMLQQNRRSLPLSLQDNLLENTKNSSLSSIDMTSEETVRTSVNKRINKIKQKVLKSIDNSVQSHGSEHLYDFNNAFLLSSSSTKSSVPESTLPRNINLDLSFSDGEDDVFVEAKKLADTLNENFPGISEIDLKDDSEDLMSINTKWEPVDSSDEETDRLRNDPALNLKFSSSSFEQLPTPKKAIEFSEAVIQYTKRRSLNLNSSLSIDCSTPSVPEIAVMKRSHSFNGTDTPKKEKEKLQDKITIPDPLAITDCLIKKQPGAVPITQEDFSQKLKVRKPQGVVNKKGPLKAVLPVQKMTRLDATKELKKKESPKIRASVNSAPQKGISSSTKKKHCSQPVASSTPNKNTPVGSSPASSPIPKINTSSQKFHQSLDSAEKLQESRVQSSPLSRISSGKQNIIGNQKFNSSGSELKKRSLRLSQLPRVKPRSVLNSQNGNRVSQLPVLPQPLTGANIIDKVSSKLITFPNRRALSNDKENILPV